ncbi:MAG: type II toxin-antitoxin system VapC family toxin [Candidatus Hodarchaeales archaeon]
MALDRVGHYHRWKRTTVGIIISSFGESEKVIFLDTNFLMAIGQMTSFNITYELDRVLPGKRELIVLEPILYELNKLRQSGKIKVEKEAQIALLYVEKECKIWKTDYNHRNIDFVLLEYGKRYTGIIATNDRQLKRLARKKGLLTLFIRNQSYLMLE